MSRPHFGGHKFLNFHFPFCISLLNLNLTVHLHEMKKKKLDSGTHLLMYFTSRDNRRIITCMADETEDKNKKIE